MRRVFLGTALRDGAPNVASHNAGHALVGRDLRLTVDVGATSHPLAGVCGFDTPTDVLPGGGQRLLCFDGGGSGELLQTSAMPGPVARFRVPIPGDPSLFGATLCTQAVHFGGAGPFVLSNAQDLSIGF